MQVKITLTLLSGVELPIVVNDGEAKSIQDRIMTCIDHARAYRAELGEGVALIINCTNVILAKVEQLSAELPDGYHG